MICNEKFLTDQIHKAFNKIHDRYNKFTSIIDKDLSIINKSCGSKFHVDIDDIMKELLQELCGDEE